MATASPPAAAISSATLVAGREQWPALRSSLLAAFNAAPPD